MKTRILLLAGLMAAALTACNKEENQEGPAGPQQGHIPGDGAYMQLQIIGPTSGAATRTTPAEDGEETGSDDENRISSLTILLCNSTDHSVVQRFYLTSEDLSEITVSDNDPYNNYPGYQTPQLELNENVTVANGGTLYEIYVIANDKGAEGQSYYTGQGTDIRKAFIGNDGTYGTPVSEKLMQSDYAAAGKFLMFNECNGSSDTHGNDSGSGSTPADKCGTFITITPENVYDNPATCSLIRLDRLAVKITSDAKNSAGTATTIGDIANAIRYDSDNDGTTEQHTKGITAVTLKGFKLLNGAEKVYLQQHWTNTSDGQNQTGGTVYPYTNTLITPAMTAASETGTVTVTDNYYNTLSDFRTLTKKAVSGNYSPEYTAVVDKYDLDGSPAYYDQTNPTGPIYCMENNPTYDASAASANPLYYKEALIGNTTGLVYQWQATLADGLSDEAAGENCFYSYGDKYYGRLADIQKDFPAVFDPATTAAPQNNWETLEKLTGITVDSQDAANLAQAMTELRAARAIEVPDDRQGAISDWRIEYNIRVYTDGLMYYLYFIKDENYRQIQSDEPSAQPEQYYSVMRNTVYKLNITSLGAIGTDIPGGWNPDVIEDNPVDDTSLYMQVEVQANPWVVSQTDITLK